mgnify:CR=1 FL=1
MESTICLKAELKNNMAITSCVTQPHWNYFLAIERDMDVLSRYIEFDERNFGCFSIEIARVLLAAGAESDVVCKQLCQAVAPQTAAKNINDYIKVILDSTPKIASFQIDVPRFGLELHPWDELQKSGNRVPLWWTAYNKIKHHRNSHYNLANLKNALNAVAGLFVVTLYHYKTEAEFGKLSAPQLFRAGPGHVMGGRVKMDPSYKL